MPANFTVSSDINTFLRKPTKEDAATFLGLEDTKAQWGQITGTLSTQTDLQSALDAKGSATAVSTNTSNIATNATNIATKAPSASPTFTGTATFSSSGAANFDGQVYFNDDVEFQADAAFQNQASFEDEVEFQGGVEFQDDIELTSGKDVIASSSSKIQIGDLHISEGEIVINNDSELFRLATDERTLIGQGDETVLDWSSHDQTCFPASDAKVGIRKSNPSAALDVNGTIKANSLNVNSQKFYVDPNDDYIKAGGYGSGDFSTLTGSENQPKSTPAFGSGGKVVENTQIKTFKIVGSGFVGLGNTPVVIVTKAGTGKYIVPQRMTVYNDYGTRSGEWGSNNSEASIQIGTFQNSDNTGNFAPLLTIPQSTAETNGDWLSHKTIRNAEVKQFANRDLVLKSKNNIATEANAPDGIWYVRLEYMIIGESAGFENNVDQTIGTPFS